MRLLSAMLLCVCAFGQAPADRKPDRVISIVAERFTFNPSKVTVTSAAERDWLMNLRYFFCVMT